MYTILFGAVSPSSDGPELERKHVNYPIVGSSDRKPTVPPLGPTLTRIVGWAWERRRRRRTYVDNRMPTNTAQVTGTLLQLLVGAPDPIIIPVVRVRREEEEASPQEYGKRRLSSSSSRSRSRSRSIDVSGAAKRKGSKQTEQCYAFPH